MTVAVAEPRVAVIVPVFNGEAYLRQSLQCIEQQEYSNIEVIICDDGSRDFSATEIEHYQAHSRWPVIVRRHDYNQGATAAVRTCVNSISKQAQYITFFSQDDLLPANFVSVVVAKLDASKHVGIQTGASVIDAQGNRVDLVLAPPLLALRTFARTAVLFGKNYVQAVGFTVRANALAWNVDSEDYPQSQDWWAWLHVSTLGTIATTFRTHAVYRLHSSSLSQSSSEMQRLMEFRDMRLDFVRSPRAAAFIDSLGPMARRVSGLLGNAMVLGGERSLDVDTVAREWQALSVRGFSRKAELPAPTGLSAHLLRRNLRCGLAGYSSPSMRLVMASIKTTLGMTRRLFRGLMRMSFRERRLTPGDQGSIGAGEKHKFL